MKKLAAVILAVALVGCNELLDPGPPVQTTHDGTVAQVAYTGEVQQIAIEQFMLYPEGERSGIRLVGHEDELNQLVGHVAYVEGVMQLGALHVRACHCAETDTP